VGSAGKTPFIHEKKKREGDRKIDAERRMTPAKRNKNRIRMVRMALFQGGGAEGRTRDNRNREKRNRTLKKKAPSQYRLRNTRKKKKGVNSQKKLKRPVKGGRETGGSTATRGKQRKGI